MGRGHCKDKARLEAVAVTDTQRNTLRCVPASIQLALHLHGTLQHAEQALQPAETSAHAVPHSQETADAVGDHRLSHAVSRDHSGERMPAPHKTQAGPAAAPRETQLPHAIVPAQTGRAVLQLKVRSPSFTNTKVSAMPGMSGTAASYVLLLLQLAYQNEIAAALLDLCVCLTPFVSTEELRCSSSSARMLGKPRMMQMESCGGE